MFIISVIITWIALSLLLIWVRPALYNADGSINWWTTLWISAVLIIFVWIICLILVWIIKAFSGNCNTGCPKKVVEECDPCAKKKVVVDECDPCAKGKAVVVNTNGNMVNMPPPGTFAPVGGMW